MNKYLEECLRIRMVENHLLQMYQDDKLVGTTHTSIGQESCAVGVCSALNLDKDIVISNHRCHGHYLAYGGPMKLLLDELQGKPTGMCKGIGGSQHIHWKNFYSNGIIGGTAPLAAGMAYAEKLKKSGAIACLFMGDGVFGQGIFYETLNMVSLLKLPVLFAVEVNGYSQTTSLSENLAGSIDKRFKAFGIKGITLQPSMPVVISDASQRLIDQVRNNEPKYLIMNTYRLAPHSKGDDYRDKEEITQAQEDDILKKMIDQADDKIVSELGKKIEMEIADAFI